MGPVPELVQSNAVSREYSFVRGLGLSLEVRSDVLLLSACVIYVL